MDLFVLVIISKDFKLEKYLFNTLDMLNIISFFSLSGPWFIGEVIEGHVGACFSFGLIVDGQFFEGSSTFIVGILQVGLSA